MCYSVSTKIESLTKTLNKCHVETSRLSATRGEKEENHIQKKSSGTGEEEENRTIEDI